MEGSASCTFTRLRAVVLLVFFTCMKAGALIWVTKHCPQPKTDEHLDTREKLKHFLVTNASLESLVVMNR